MVYPVFTKCRKAGGIANRKLDFCPSAGPPRSLEMLAVGVFRCAGRLDRCGINLWLNVSRPRGFTPQGRVEALLLDKKLAYKEPLP